MRKVRFAIFVRKRELYATVLCSFKNLGTKNLLTNELRWFVSFHEGRMSPAALAQGKRLKSGRLPLLSLVTDVLMIRERC